MRASSSGLKPLPRRGVGAGVPMTSTGAGAGTGAATGTGVGVTGAGADVATGAGAGIVAEGFLAGFAVAVGGGVAGVVGAFVAFKFEIAWRTCSRSLASSSGLKFAKALKVHAPKIMAAEMVIKTFWVCIP